MHSIKDRIKQIILLSTIALTSILHAENLYEAKVENCTIKLNKDKLDIECDNVKHKFKYGQLFKLPDVYDSTLFTYENEGVQKIGIFYTETTGNTGACAINVQKNQPLYNCTEGKIDTKKGEIMKIERRIVSTIFEVKGHKNKIRVTDESLNRK